MGLRDGAAPPSRARSSLTPVDTKRSLRRARHVEQICKKINLIKYYYVPDWNTYNL